MGRNTGTAYIPLIRVLLSKPLVEHITAESHWCLLRRFLRLRVTTPADSRKPTPIIKEDPTSEPGAHVVGAHVPT